MNSPRRKRRSTALLLSAVIYFAIQPASFAASPAFQVANPNWFINLTEFGYADIAADVSGGGSGPLYFREYLSGEWGAAIAHAGAPAPEWLEPSFVYPDWTTNSTFSVATPFSFRDRDANGPDVNADGLNIYTSAIRNASFAITMTYEFLNTGTGIAQGTQPATVAGPGANVTSNPFVLKQTYQITNVSGAPMQDVRLSQFLHGLHSRLAVFDRTGYGESANCGGVSCGTYQYDITMRGTARAFVDLDRPFVDEEGQPRRATDATDLFGFVPALDDAFLRSLLGKTEAAIDSAFRGIRVTIDPATIAGIARSDAYVVNDDLVAFHSNDAPLAWEVGRYGVRPNDNHEVGKPGTGVHLSVESGTLNGTSSIGPGDKWVGGAQVFSLGNLNPGGSVTFDVLLSVSTTQSVTPRTPSLVRP
jgi:hypothetical protein